MPLPPGPPAEFAPVAMDDVPAVEFATPEPGRCDPKPMLGKDATPDATAFLNGLFRDFSGEPDDGDDQVYISKRVMFLDPLMLYIEC